MALTLSGVVVAVLVVASLGYDVENVFAIALTSLVVALLSTLLALAVHRTSARRHGDDPRPSLDDLRIYQIDPASRPLHHFGVGLVWMAATVLAVERAIHFGVNGWLASGLWLVITVAALAAYGSFVGRHTRAGLRAQREAYIQHHQTYVHERQQLARRGGDAYEDTSVALAEGFGRLDQSVPDDFVTAEVRLAPFREAFTIERTAPMLRHAATLRAEAVMRTRSMGFPVVVFDLELIDHTTLLNRDRSHISDPVLAADVAKRYLTVWMTELPMALPFVSSLFAYELAYTRPEYVSSHETTLTTTMDMWFSHLEGHETGDAQELQRHRIGLMTENEQLARHLMAVPAIWEAALAPATPPFFIDGDRLVASDYSINGTGAAEVTEGIARLGGLAQAFPWTELAPYRVDAADYQRRRADRFFLTHGSLEPTLERWQMTSTRSGPRMFERSHHLKWANQHHTYTHLMSPSLAPPTFPS